MKACPECKSQVPDDAAVCSACGERIKGQQCPNCLSICKPGARMCKWCHHQFEKATKLIEFKPFTIVAAFIPTVLLRGRLFRQRISLTQEKVVIHTPGYFALYHHYEEIPWAKVAGFDYRRGIFWDLVEIETRGQKSAKMRCLTKRDGPRLRAILQQLDQ